MLHNSKTSCLLELNQRTISLLSDIRYAQDENDLKNGLMNFTKPNSNSIHIDTLLQNSFDEIDLYNDEDVKIAHKILSELSRTYSETIDSKTEKSALASINKLKGVLRAFSNTFYRLHVNSVLYNPNDCFQNTNYVIAIYKQLFEKLIIDIENKGREKHIERLLFDCKNICIGAFSLESYCIRSERELQKTDHNSIVWLKYDFEELKSQLESISKSDYFTLNTTININLFSQLVSISDPLTRLTTTYYRLTGYKVHKVSLVESKKEDKKEHKKEHIDYYLVKDGISDLNELKIKIVNKYGNKEIKGVPLAELTVSLCREQIFSTKRCTSRGILSALSRTMHTFLNTGYLNEKTTIDKHFTSKFPKNEEEIKTFDLSQTDYLIELKDLINEVNKEKEKEK